MAVSLGDMSAREEPSLWMHTLLLPSHVAAASATVLVLQAILSSRPVRNLCVRAFGPVENDSATSGGSGGSGINPIPIDNSTLAVNKDHMDRPIFLLRILRLISVLTLLSLSLFDLILRDAETCGSPDQPFQGSGPLDKGWVKTHREILYRQYDESPCSKSEWPDLTLCATYIYATTLALCTVVSRRSSVPIIASHHLTLLLLVTFGVYAYRDIWPLLTYTLAPADQPGSALLWVKIGIMYLAAVLIPLVTPRQYTPVDPKDPQSVINPEQTASILSSATCSFLDPIVFLAYRVPHLSHDMLPPLADYDYARNLVKRSFKHLDTFSGSPKRHIFWGLMKVFSREYIELGVLTIILTVSSLGAPFGMNRLLRYIETNGEGAQIRPWVWIAYLFLGPAFVTISDQRYLFVMTRMLTRLRAIVTQLVFEHALRARIKTGATSSSAVETIPETYSDMVRSEEYTVSGVTPALGGDEASAGEDGQEVTQSNVGVQQRHEATRSPVGKKDAGEKGRVEVDKSFNFIGRMNNLVTTDLANVVEGRDFLQLIIQVPLQVTLCAWFIYSILGWSAFVGMAVMVLLFPVPGAVARQIQKVQKETSKRTDARVQTAIETMSVLRMIKLFGWERKVATRLAEKRERELDYIKKRKLLSLVNGIVNAFIPIITVCGPFSAIMGKALTPSAVFSSMAVFDILRDQLRFSFQMITDLTQAKVSIDRLNDFFHETELLDEFSDSEKASKCAMLADSPNHDRDAIGFCNASFAWSKSDENMADGTLTPSRSRFTLRVHGELVFKRGCINMIIGPTGAGKTSLLMALLGEMHFIPMGPDAWYNLPRGGGVSYAAQESWVQNETIRENILFGAPYDETRYRKVIYQCGLTRDLSLFEAGDRTEVGEKGLTLSGGQKARVTLARAVYSSAEILLLDDVLAALDVHTARWIVDKCFKGGLIRGRTVLLVTHNVAMVTPIAENVVSFGPDGSITGHGSVSDALAKDESLAAEFEEEMQAIVNDEEVDSEEPGVPETQTDGKLILAEEIQLGRVSRDARKLLISGLAGTHAFTFWLLFVGGLVVFDAIMSAQVWFMGSWAEQYRKVRLPEEVSVGYYLSVYSLLMIAAIIAYAVGSGVYVLGAMRASRSIHQQLIVSVLCTTLRWLDTTPTSRVIARVTQDISSIDGPVSEYLSSVTVAVVYITPVFIIPGIFIGALGAWIGHVYMRAQLAIKREMSNAAAPVLGHFGAAMAGLTSIRAYDAQLAYRLGLHKRIDKYSRAMRSFQNMNRWISLRVDFLGSFFAAGLAAYLVYMPGNRVLSSDTGFSLTMAIGFSTMILLWVRTFNRFEVHSEVPLLCIPLERMLAYINAEQEAKPTKEGIPPAYWPASGDLQVERLSARYSPDGPKVLHDISFHIKSGERVGVVGRTGSGKSSLTLSLLRCIFAEGEVYYDGKLTSSINLDALRSAITIIPQTPDLLSGTLRENLDPFSQYDDATLNAALRTSGLYSLQSDEDEGRLTLDSSIASGGGNLSVGQRQILALARAIVRDSKLLILDEDYSTDAVIQTSLRNGLKGDVTLITVAHRLQTIMDADKIMVLDAGRIVEFDKPSELLKNKDGWLRALVDESGDRDALYAMAAKKAE
ncbi:P-loop containing nucleoside triphosphate hydrolase protein [Gloeopeniophorella convolvens]|nr:P-loop containing nucleoside triphosphate hydrolase protein [Gloeopeniophorella convolvens]